MKKSWLMVLCLMLSTLAFSKSYSSGRSSSSSSRSYSSGRSSSSSSRSYSSGSRSYSSGRSSSSSSSSSKSYSSPSSSSASKSSGGGWSSWSSSTAKKQADSSRSYEAYKSSKRVFPSAPTPEYRQQRDTRQQSAFSGYYNNPTVVNRYVYHDSNSFNPWFWMWLMDRSSSDRAEWAYHHKSELSEERYRDLVEKDKAAQERIKALEAQQVAKDPSFAPKGIDKDLMYDPDAKEPEKDDEDGFGFVGIMLLITGLGVIGLVAYKIMNG